MGSLIQTEGIVLRTIKYGETSMISHLLTRDKGILVCIMGGVTTANQKKAMFQLMNQLEVMVYYNEHRDMHRLKEARYVHLYQNLPFEINRTAVGIFILELLRKSVQGHDQDPRLYDWVKYCLLQCDATHQSIQWMPLYFLIGLTKHLGFCPLANKDEESAYFDLMEGSYTKYLPPHGFVLDGECLSLFSDLLTLQDYHQTGSLHIYNKQVRKSLLYSLLDYYKLHIDHFKGLDSPAVLEEILTA